MSRAAVALLLVLAGCDKLFDLDRLQRPDDAMVVVGDGGDASDATDALEIDAAPCAAPSGHDEDGDGVDDACDACPTVHPGTGGNGNADGDSLPDHCDPRPSTPGDKIGKVWFFITMGELSEFDTANALHNATSDLVAVGGNGFLTSQVSYDPVSIELNVTGFLGSGLTAETWIQNGSNSCRVLAGDCTNGATDKACLIFNLALGSTFNDLAAKATRLVMTDNTSVICKLTGPNASAMVLGNGALTSAPITIQTSAAGQTSVTSIVVYTAP